MALDRQKVGSRDKERRARHKATLSRTGVMCVKLECLEGRMVLSSEIGKAGGGPGLAPRGALARGEASRFGIRKPKLTPSSAPY